MNMDEGILSRPPITRSEIVASLRALGVRSGSIVMVHAGISSLGHVIGGADAIVQALLETLGEKGTVMAYVGWEYDPCSLSEWPRRVRSAYREDPPVFDAALSEGARDFGRLPERIRTWPGALRSNHPEASITAIGARAAWIITDHPWHHPYGRGSPLAKLRELEGDVLMLGAPLETLTILHHAEELADIADKKQVRYSTAVRIEKGIEWREVQDIDTGTGAFDYENEAMKADAFEVIAREALGSGIGRHARIGESDSYLLPSAELVRFAIHWLEQRFG